jgi:hypothetical protein
VLAPLRELPALVLDFVEQPHVLRPSVNSWSNAFDTRDIVALYPLDPANFPVSPAITNYNKVNNHTDNRHGIDGYLDNPIVTKWVLDALM